MATAMDDDIDLIMQVMEAGFDPAYGEAWTRRQVSDALLLGNCRYLLADQHGNKPLPGVRAAGFAMSRRAADEEELLLLAVSPEFRRSGIATRMLTRMSDSSRELGVTKLFLEMREGNPAEFLYRNFGFAPIGRRPAYYKLSNGSRKDAITFALTL